MAQLSLSMNDILKDAQRIHEYRGDETYALTSFLREVDTIFSLIQHNAEAKEYIYQRVVLNKIQGEALHVLRTLGPNPSWDETKEALISNFGIHESYHQLYQHAFEAKNVCIINYYKQLREILCKLNEKYEYDKEKPVEFSPLYVEKIILKTFLNNIDLNLASVVINRNIDKLRDAFNLLEREGLIRLGKEKKIVDQPKRDNNYDYNSFKRNSNRLYVNSNHNNGNNRNINVNSSQTRSFNSNQYSRNYQRNGSNVHRSFGNVNNSSIPNVNSEMEVDHIQFSQNANSNEEEQVNFLTTASKRHFQ